MACRHHWLKEVVMIKLGTTSAVLMTAISMTGSVWATDMPARVPLAPVAACSWCGFYVGLNVGANWGRSEATLTPGQFWNQDPNAAFFGISGSPAFNQTNFTGGGQVGVNSQSGRLVVGLEADVEYIGFSVSRNATFTGPFAGPSGGTAEVFNFADSVKDSWVSTQRLRFGWAASPAFLVYGTGGLALSEQSFSQTYTIPNFNGGGLAPGFTASAIGTGSVSKLVAGWAAGGGAEWKFARNWSVRAEYLYIDLGKREFDSMLVGTAGGGAGVIGAGFTAHHEDHIWTNVARVGINYQF
jgi:outer membrane immunogenic protein